MGVGEWYTKNYERRNQKSSFPTVRTNFLARVLCSLAAEEACFRMRVTHVVVLIRSLVIHVCVSECFRNGSGVHPYLLVQKKSSNLDRAPKMRDSVLLYSWDSFLVTLPSISSESCVIYSSLILGTDVFRDWPFLGFSSCVSLVTAANVRLFLNVAIFLKGNATQLWGLNYFVFVNKLEIITKMLFFKINN